MLEFSDNELIDKTRKGDNEAYGIIVRRYIKSLYDFVMRLSGNKSDAEDIVQDAFVKAWKKIKRFNTHRSFKPWLYTIAKNTFLDSIKNKKEIPISSFDTEDGNFIEDTVIDVSLSAEDIFDTSLKVQDLQKHINTLSPIYQIVLTLHLKEELTFQEISDILGVSIDTIKSRYRRACTKLRGLVV